MKPEEVERRIKLLEALLCDFFRCLFDKKALTLHEIETRAIREALARNGFSQKHAAKELGISERVISYKLKGNKHGRTKRKTN